MEQAVFEEIGREVKLDLELRRLRCTSATGCNVTTNIFSVLVDSRQVSKVVKGLRAVLNKNYVPPTRRALSFVLKDSDDLTVQKKNAHLIMKHHKCVVKERKLYRNIGVPIDTKVVMRNGRTHTLQQALCTITNTNGEQMFTGVEQMGRTDTSLFTAHKKNLSKGT